MFSYLKIPLRIAFFISIFCIAPQLTKVLLIYSYQRRAGSHIIQLMTYSFLYCQIFLCSN